MDQRWPGDVILDGSTLLTIDEVDEAPPEATGGPTRRPSTRSAVEVHDERRPSTRSAVTMAEVLDHTRDSQALTHLVRWIDGELRQRLITVEDKLSSLNELHSAFEAPPFRRRRRRSKGNAFGDDAPDGALRRRRAVLHGPLPMVPEAVGVAAPAAKHRPDAPEPRSAFLRSASSVSRMAYLSSRSSDTLGPEPSQASSSFPRPVTQTSHSSMFRVQRADTRSLEAMAELETRLRSRFARCGCHDTIWHFLEEPGSSRAATLYNKFMPVLIMVSVVLTVLQSGNPAPLGGLAPAVIDMGLDAFFSAEIIVRWFASPRWSRFFCSGYNLIDLTSVMTLPLRVVLVRNMAWGQHDASLPVWLTGATMVLECIAPVTRLLKLLRRFEKFHLLYHAFELAFEALPVLLYTGALLMLGASALIYFCEAGPDIDSFPRAMWLSVVTMSTVGYGDYSPKTTPGYTPHDINTFFLLFSSSGDGAHDVIDFRRMSEEMKLGLGADRTRQLFEIFDVEGSGLITPEDFVSNLFPNVVYEFAVERGKQDEGGSAEDQGSSFSGGSRG